MTDTARVGFVGLGGRGTTHADALADLPHRVAAGADVVAETRDAFEDRFGVPTYEDFEEMYDDVSLDAVVVSTPNAFHAPAAVAALERDVAVLVEKPLADGVDAAERVVEAHGDSDAFCMVGFNNRFAAAPQLFVEQREAGRFGELRHVDATYRRRRGVPGHGSWFTDGDLSGGGALVDLGVHAIDLALYLLGYPDVESVTGVTRSDIGSRRDYADPDGWNEHWDTETDGAYDVEDEALAFVRTASGATFSLDVAWATNAEPEHGLEVRGTRAGAQLGIGGSDLTILGAEKGAVDHYEDVDLRGRTVQSDERQLATFLDGVLAGEAPDMNTVEEGLLVQRVIDAVYRSSEAGGPVDLADGEAAHPSNRQQ